MSVQLEHNQTRMLRPKRSIRVFAPHLGFQDNIGGLFRLCDAMGVSELILGAEVDLTARRLRKAARSSVFTLPISFVLEDHAAFIQREQREGYTVIGLELTDSSIPLPNLNPAPEEKILWVIGHEMAGISHSLLEVIPVCYHISMYGQNSSMNVINAMGMALFHLRAQE